MIWLGLVLAGLVILAMVGAIYESLAEASDMRAYSPPGQLVDVGGYRLHIYCTGSGSPTVVIDAGWGDSSAGWSAVQAGVQKTTRVCTYDRAGTGWSEASPEPRTAREYARELHTLLQKANEPGPYVLAGHSMGGYTVIVYAHDYPDDVAGLVLIDAQALTRPDVTPSPAPKPGRRSFAWWMARIGVVRLLTGRSAPAEAPSVAPRSVQAVLDEAMGMAEGGTQARAVTSLGSLPLIVLSRGQDQTPEWEASQAGYVKLSTDSQRLFAEKSGHRINVDQPEAAISAIVKMVEQVRG